MVVSNFMLEPLEQLEASTTKQLSRATNLIIWLIRTMLFASGTLNLFVVMAYLLLVLIVMNFVSFKVLETLD